MNKHAISFEGVKALTKQSFKDECNINKIMDKFQKSGAITHFAKNAPTYGDTTSPMLHDALNIVADAESMFEELPSAIRKKFNNDPGQFLEFVQNPDNLDEMRELGLANKKTSPVTEETQSEPPPVATSDDISPKAVPETNKPKGSPDPV